MKKIIFGLLLMSGLGSLSACKESSKDPAPAVTSVPLLLPQPSSDPEKDHFDTRRANVSTNNLATLANPTRPVFEFTFAIPDQRDVNIKAVEVYKSFQRGNFIGPRAFFNSYTSFPATVSVNSQTALAGLKRLGNAPTGVVPALYDLLGATASAPNPVVAGDRIVFTFEYVLQDGSRVILTPLSDVKINDGSTVKVISGTQINPPYAIYGRFFTR